MSLKDKLFLFSYFLKLNKPSKHLSNIQLTPIAEQMQAAGAKTNNKRIITEAK